MKKREVFQELIEEAIKKKHFARHTESSMAWFRRKCDQMIADIRPRDFLKEDDRLKKTIEYGKLYHFYYDPKNKKTLPYYDKFPLCFPIKKTSNGFIGLNLHYLPHNMRAAFMTELYAITNNKKYDSTTRLIMTYELLNKTARFKYFRPCIKRYIRKHVISSFVEIPGEDWKIAIFMPTESFVKEDKKTVWKDSRRIIKGN